MSRFVPVALSCSLLLSIAAGCSSNAEPSPCHDRDGDGFNELTSECPSGRDCNDDNMAINPDADELCNDGKDNDCDGATDSNDEDCQDNSTECVDQDDDGYGKNGHQSCRNSGEDCNDNDPDIHPDAKDICGDGKDQNCDGEDTPCNKCTDKDGDGYGVEGSNEDCRFEGIDCNDENPDINPGAEEVCDGKDNNCNGEKDECELDGATCNGTGEDARCVVDIGDDCNEDDNCKNGMRCDPRTNTCRQTSGQNCSDDSDCLSGLACSNSTCSGDFCDVTNCSEDRPGAPFCDSEAERCVECPAWKEGGGNAECSGIEKCTFEGWCAPYKDIPGEQPSEPNSNLANDVFLTTQAIIDCWLNNKDLPDPKKDMCAALVVEADVSTIRESELRSAYTDGKFQFLSQERLDALEDLWGEGVFNAKNIEWRANIKPGTLLKSCIWFDPDGVDSVVIDKCKNFSR